LGIFFLLDAEVQRRLIKKITGVGFFLFCHPEKAKSYPQLTIKTTTPKSSGTSGRNGGSSSNASGNTDPGTPAGTYAVNLIEAHKYMPTTRERLRF
jgi:hypothetical protein